MFQCVSSFSRVTHSRCTLPTWQDRSEQSMDKHRKGTIVYFSLMSNTSWDKTKSKASITNITAPKVSTVKVWSIDVHLSTAREQKLKYAGKGREKWTRIRTRSRTGPICPSVVLTSANLWMSHWQVWITIECFLAIAAMSADGVMFALNTDSTGLSTREQIEFLVESALPRMIVAIAGYKQKKTCRSDRYDKWSVFLALREIDQRSRSSCSARSTSVR